MTSNADRYWALAFRVYCRVILALGSIPGFGWKAADAFSACIPGHLRRRAALAYQASST